MDTLNKIEELIAQARTHGEKLYEKETKNAAPKLRKVYQDIKALCMEGRKEALTHQKAIAPKRKRKAEDKTGGDADEAEADDSDSD